MVRLSEEIIQTSQQTKEKRSCLETVRTAREETTATVQANIEACMDAFVLVFTVHTAAVEHHTDMNDAQRVTTRTRTSWSWAGDETVHCCLTGDGRCAGHWECTDRLNQHWGLRRRWILTRRMWPKMDYMQKYVKEQGDTSLCNVTEQGKVPIIQEQESQRSDRSSSEWALREQKTFHKASRKGHSRAATGRGAGRACCGWQHKHGRSTRLHNRNRLHQTCRPVNQFEHVCVEECPLTTRHTAAAATAAKSRNDWASAGLQPGGRSREKPNHGKTQERVSPERNKRSTLTSILRLATWTG